jgi:hypothetical protein
VRALLLALLLWLAAGTAAAHKASDAYLRLAVGPGTVTGAIDVALRDLELAVGLDADGDAAVTWGEVRARHPAIAAYLTERLVLDRGGPCALRVAEQLIARHTDGAYAVARFAADCPGTGPLRLRYGLLFEQDPLHRGLLTAEFAGAVTTTVLSPEAPETVLDAATAPSGFLAYLALGFDHISYGVDHLLFLLVVLLPAAFREDGRRMAVELLKILTAFTLAHGLSLALAVLGVVELPSRLVESAIALTIVLTALDNLRPFLPGRRWQVTFVFGLIHGLGFASALGPADLPPRELATALLGFNLGIEAGQVIVAVLFLAAVRPLRGLAPLARGLLPAGSAAAAALAGLWLVDRAFALGLAF